MYKKITKTSLVIQLAIFIIIALMLWLPAFKNPMPAQQTDADGPIYTFLYTYLKTQPLLSAIIGFVWMLFSSFFVFYIINSFFLFGRDNLFPALLATLLFSWNSDYMTLHSTLFVYPLLLLVLLHALKLYNNNNANYPIFGISFWMGVASLIYFPLTYMLVFLWFVLIVFRYTSIRHYVIVLVGFLLPFLYYLFGLFWNGNITWGYNDFITHIYTLNVYKNIDLPMKKNIFLLFLSLYSALSLMVTFVLMRDKHISDKKRFLTILYFLWTTAIALFLTGFAQQVINASFLFIFPFVFGIMGMLYIPKRTIIIEILFTIMLVLYFTYKYIWS